MFRIDEIGIFQVRSHKFPAQHQCLSSLNKNQNIYCTADKSFTLSVSSCLFDLNKEEKIAKPEIIIFKN